MKTRIDDTGNTFLDFTEDIDMNTMIARKVADEIVRDREWKIRAELTRLGWTPPRDDNGHAEQRMTVREHEAMRAAVNIMLRDMRTVAAVLTKMRQWGYTAEEAQAAVNEIAKHHAGCPGERGLGGGVG